MLLHVRRFFLIDGSEVRVMKRLLVVFVLAVVSAGTVSANTWYLGRHGMDKQVLLDEITAKANDGFVPMGLSINAGYIYVLYYKSDSFKFSRWSLNWYDSVDELKQGITGKMNDGYLPTGFNYTGSRIYVLYIKTSFDAKRWQIVPADSDEPEAFTRAVASWTADYFLPVGISIYGGRYYALMVQIPGTTAKRWALRQYEASNSVLKAGLDDMVVNKGWIPWGFSYRNGVAHVIYLK